MSVHTEDIDSADQIMQLTVGRLSWHVFDAHPRASIGTGGAGHDRDLAVPSKNHRHSVNLQVAIDADTHLAVAVGQPLPGNRNDCRAFTDSRIAAELAGRPVMVDGGYRGTSALIPHYRRRPEDQLTDWQERDNAAHRRIRARIEHAIARMKCWKVLRDYRRKADTFWHTAAGVAHLHNLTLAG